MHTKSPLLMLRLLAILTAALMFSGCGSDDRKEDESKEKPPSERVQILKERFGQLENSLNEMERDLVIQKKRIEKTRETAKAIRQSLIKGNLKGYSIDMVSTDTQFAHTKNAKEKEKNKKSQAEDKEEAEHFFLNTALIILFIIFLIVIFFVALKDRNQSTPNDLWPPAYPDTKTDPAPGDVSSGATGDTEGYQQLGPQGEQHHDHGNHGDHHHEGDHHP